MQFQKSWRGEKYVEYCGDREAPCSLLYMGEATRESVSASVIRDGYIANDSTATMQYDNADHSAGNMQSEVTGKVSGCTNSRRHLPLRVDHSALADLLGASPASSSGIWSTYRCLSKIKHSGLDTTFRDFV